MRTRVTRLALGSILLYFIYSYFGFSISASAASAPDCTQSSNTKCLVTFSYTGAVETFTVPAGITSIYFDVEGAQGGDGKISTTVTSLGGKGGADTGTLAVAGGQILTIRVGGAGATGNSATGGYNGGGFTSATASYLPGSGGGASDIRTGGDSLPNRVVVAGGGGGASGYCYSAQSGDGGYGGGLTAREGGYGVAHTGCWSSAYGTGGSQTSGGVEVGYTGDANSSGTLGVGGKGTGHSDGGGAGGGGYYGGAGAGVGPGGGGSSFVDSRTVTNYGMSIGSRSGNGIVTFLYQNLLPANISLTTPQSATFRTVTSLTSTSDSPGKVTFFAGGKAIPGCKGILNSGSGSNYTATCNWKPNVHGNQVITVSIAPSNGNIGASASAPSVGTNSRSNNR